jgi:hypothetical protein
LLKEHCTHFDVITRLVEASQFDESILGLKFCSPGRASRIPTETPTPEDDDQQVVHGSEPQSKIIYSDSLTADEQASSEVLDEESSAGQRLLVLLLVFLGLAISAAGTIYWIQSRNFPVVVAISPPDRPAKPDPLGDRGTLVPVGPDLLHVTSIALGNPRLTIVNGKRLAEEDWLVVKTPQGEASVRVILIQDGLVRFKHGGETIDARLQLATGSPAPH